MRKGVRVCCFFAKYSSNVLVYREREGGGLLVGCLTSQQVYYKDRS